MGFTPLEGLVMGTRSGDLDPALVAFLARREDIPADEVEVWLNRRSGLLGVSGISADPRELRIAAEGGDPRAALALDLYCYRALKYVGAYLAALGGAQALVFAGGVGENDPTVRARISEGLTWCGLRLDPARNEAALGTESRIAADGSAIDVYVIPTREERWIARETARCLAGVPVRKEDA
jgi:acetate kinase